MAWVVWGHFMEKHPQRNPFTGGFFQPQRCREDEEADEYLVMCRNEEEPGYFRHWAACRALQNTQHWYDVMIHSGYISSWLVRVRVAIPSGRSPTTHSHCW